MPIEKFGQMMLFALPCYLFVTAEFDSLSKSVTFGICIKTHSKPIAYLSNFVIVLNSHAYVDKKTIVIFIKETTNVKEAFPTVKLSSPKQKSKP